MIWKSMDIMNKRIKFIERDINNIKYCLFNFVPVWNKMYLDRSNLFLSIWFIKNK